MDVEQYLFLQGERDRLDRMMEIPVGPNEAAIIKARHGRLCRALEAATDAMLDEAEGNMADGIRPCPVISP